MGSWTFVSLNPRLERNEESRRPALPGGVTSERHVWRVWGAGIMIWGQELRVSEFGFRVSPRCGGGRDMSRRGRVV